MVRERPEVGGRVKNRVLITGGCGFIGSNLAAHYLDKGWEVMTYDNLSRPGAEKNAAWLRELGDGRLTIAKDDIRDFKALRTAVEGADIVFHLAAQVAVTTSIHNPRADFSVNALGGLNILEAIREARTDPIVIYSSTNKVYGALKEVRVANGHLRYRLPDYPQGVSEEFPLDLYSPYGCSKGACDQYMLDYARIYGLKTVVFRQSCIYGPRQFGIEDQGWVAHFVISAVLGRPITIYGDGQQVRDLLHVRDLIAACERAAERIESCQGQAYNLGGGPQNALSILELVRRLEGMLGISVPFTFSDWRPGDQRVYISDIRKAKRDLDWEPQITVDEGITELCAWVKENKELFR
ncbi:MAG: GDP-mannose 4,6-dehydratase [Chloroflexi bacterium]|nr:GDP-mannose 4,6-dehydratase [Chloroflexota bacterium]